MCVNANLPYSDDDDDEEERGTSSAGLTQEIDSAVERVLSSMMSSPGTRKRGHMFGLGEEFSPEDLRGWEMNTTPGRLKLFSGDLLVSRADIRETSDLFVVSPQNGVKISCVGIATMYCVC